MRTIKFRGKRIDNGEWVYGYYYFETFLNDKPDCSMIVEHRPDLMLVSGAADNNNWWREVVPESVGEFTGLKDKNGKEIYEGDIVKFKGNIIGKIMWGNKRMAYFFADKENNGSELGFIIHCRKGELPKIIGNIYEHSELLKQ